MPDMNATPTMMTTTTTSKYTTDHGTSVTVKTGRHEVEVSNFFGTINVRVLNASATANRQRRMMGAGRKFASFAAAAAAYKTPAVRVAIEEAAREIAIAELLK